MHLTAVMLSAYLAFLGPPTSSELDKLIPPGSPGFFGTAVAIGDGLWAVGDPIDDEFGLAAGVVYLFSAPIQPTVQPIKILPNDIGPFLGFGQAISASTKRIAVGAELRTYVFRYQNGQWIQEALIPYGGRTISFVDNKLAIGWFDSVVIYRLDLGLNATDMADDQWIEDSWIMGGTSGDSFGYTVALDHDRIVVGAPTGVLNGKETGLAYVFERNSDDSSWTQAAILEPTDATAQANFGRALSIKDDQIVVGAPWNHPSIGSGRGAAYVYRKDLLAGSWKSQGRLVARDGHENDSFGISVAIGDDAIFIGAYLAEVDGFQSAGAVYQFAPGASHGSTARWHLINRIEASDAMSGAGLGGSMACNGRALLVGASGGNAAYLFSTK